MQTAWRISTKLSRFICENLLKLLNVKWSEEKWFVFDQFVKFAVVGFSNTLISYLIYVLVLRTMNSLSVPWDYYLANIVAFLLSVLWSFYWNDKYVFATNEVHKRSLCKTLLKTYTAYAFTGLLLANFLSWVWIYVCGFSKYTAPFIILIISVPVNFLANKSWAYGVSRNEKGK